MAAYLPFSEPTKRLIAVLGAFVLVCLYQQSRLLQTQLRTVSTMEVGDLLLHAMESQSQYGSDSTTVTRSTPVRKWAYAFLIGGCSESQLEYRGFLYNVIVAAQRIKDKGSKADIVLMVQMSVHTNETTLPDLELGVLDAMGIRVRYVPKMAAPVHEVFYGLVQEKFRILDLTEYSRVLFLDGDIMPLCNMDYLFELSEPANGTALLKENVVLAWRREAANAGFFMLKPDKEDFRLIHEVIRTKEEKALALPFPHWDEVEGWGHKIEAPDFWRSPDGVTGTNWTWHAVFADQGLLYHWTKYVKQSVSLIILNDIENWGSQHGTAFLEETFQTGVLAKYTCLARDKRPSPYKDFVHFTGRSKPWDGNKIELFRAWRMNATADRPTEIGRNTASWFFSLEAAENFTNVAFDFSFATKKENNRPPVGRFSSYGTMYAHIEAKAQRNWTHYQL